MKGERGGGGPNSLCAGSRGLEKHGLCSSLMMGCGCRPFGAVSMDTSFSVCADGGQHLVEGCTDSHFGEQQQEEQSKARLVYCSL